MWWTRAGRWWAVQASTAYAIQLGFHAEARRRSTSSGVPYGPYLDIHIPFGIFSVGRNPIYAGDDDLARSFSRGGMNGDRH